MPPRWSLRPVSVFQSKDMPAELFPDSILRASLSTGSRALKGPGIDHHSTRLLRPEALSTCTCSYCCSFLRPGKAPAEQVLKDIRRQTRRQYSAEEKIRIVLDGIRGSTASRCITTVEAGMRRLAGHAARAVTTSERLSRRAGMSHRPMSAHPKRFRPSSPQRANLWARRCSEDLRWR